MRPTFAAALSLFAGCFSQPVGPPLPPQQPLTLAPISPPLERSWTAPDVSGLAAVQVNEACLGAANDEGGLGLRGQGVGGGGGYGSLGSAGVGRGGGSGAKGAPMKPTTTASAPPPPPPPAPAARARDADAGAEASKDRRAPAAVVAGAIAPAGPPADKNSGTEVRADSLSSAPPASQPAPEPSANRQAAQQPEAPREAEKKEEKPKSAEAELDDRTYEALERLGYVDAPSPRAGAVMQPPRPVVPQRRVDWGGVVYLSNDDAMSLASAQRLLWALDKGQAFTQGQIRKHELLNYFSFDQPSPPTNPNDLFTVSASGERIDGDTMGLALAVRGAAPPRGGLDLTLVIDRSGSMSAEGRMDYTHRALKLGANQLRQGDRVDVVLFDHMACTALQDFVVGRDDPSILQNVISRTKPRGSTDLNAGLTEAYRVASTHTGVGRAGRVMVFTDAVLNTGVVDPHVVSEIGRNLDAHDIRLTGVGVGTEFRDDVLNEITEKGKGAYVFLGSDKVVDRMFGAGFDALVQTIAEDVHFAIDLPDGLGMERFYGEESSSDPAAVQPVSFQAGASQVFFQDLAIRDSNLDPAGPVRLTITWTDPATHAPRSQVLDTTVGAVMSSDPRNVRKARALMAWSDVLMAKAMGADACGAPMASFRSAGALVTDDAELSYIDGLVGKMCGGRPLPPPLPSPTFANTRIHLDSDQPIGAVDLVCKGHRSTRTLSTSDTVATFSSPPGSCTVTLHGAVPMTGQVNVAATGSDVRCVIRGGRASCG